ETVESLVRVLKVVAFPDAPEQNVGSTVGAVGMAQPVAAAAPPADAIGEIKKFKALMEEGVITKEEFDAKKKQLMGI
ncbi:MAG: SHOCT domain-containing protein, partial [Oscillospiraceae bacterium]